MLTIMYSNETRVGVRKMMKFHRGERIRKARIAREGAYL